MANDNERAPKGSAPVFENPYKNAGAQKSSWAPGFFSQGVDESPAQWKARMIREGKMKPKPGRKPRASNPSKEV